MVWTRSDAAEAGRQTARLIEEHGHLSEREAAKLRTALAAAPEDARNAFFVELVVHLTREQLAEALAALSLPAGETVPVQVRLERRMVAHLDALAERRGMTRSELIRSLLVRCLVEEGL